MAARIVKTFEHQEKKIDEFVPLPSSLLGNFCFHFRKLLHSLCFLTFLLWPYPVHLFGSFAIISDGCVDAFSFVFVRILSIFCCCRLNQYIYRIVIPFKSTAAPPFCCSMCSFKLFPSISVLFRFESVFSLFHIFVLLLNLFVVAFLNFSHFHPFSFRG